jgi:hypothetical protein
VFESPSRLLSIDYRTFHGCSSLSSISVPAGIRKFHGSALAGSNVTEIVIAEGNPHLRISGSFLLDFDGISIKRYYGDGSEVVISKGIEEVDVGCFSDCLTISNVIFESGSMVSRIGMSAFENCSGLSSICIPSSIEVLRQYCFQHCSSLSSVTFESPSRIACIESSVFQHCSSLSSICIPASVAELGGQCFYSCRSLSTLTFESGSSLACIDEWTFESCLSLSSVCVPASVNNLRRHCFEGCRSLTRVTFEPIRYCLVLKILHLRIAHHLHPFVFRLSFAN